LLSASHFHNFKADEEIAPKYTFFWKYFEIGDEEIKIHKKTLFFCLGQNALFSEIV